MHCASEWARRYATEVVFESLRLPAAHFARDAALAACVAARVGGRPWRGPQCRAAPVHSRRFAVGRATSLVLEMGAGSTRVLPMYEGLPLNRGLRSSRGCCASLAVRVCMQRMRGHS